MNLASKTSFWLFFCLLAYPTFAGESLPFKATSITTKQACADQDVEQLTTQLLRDLPNYANRISQRARRSDRTADVYSYMLVAGRPEFEPLPLNPNEPNLETTNRNSSGVEQVFFTTLERQYTGKKPVELQQFHWLFLTKVEQGWHFVMMYSRTGSYPMEEPPTPPRDSSQGDIAEAVNDWLRDCRASKVKV